MPYTYVIMKAEQGPSRVFAWHNLSKKIIYGPKFVMNKHGPRYVAELISRGWTMTEKGDWNGINLDKRVQLMREMHQTSLQNDTEDEESHRDMP